MRVNVSAAHIRVTYLLLHGSNAGAAFKKMGSKDVAQCAAAGGIF